jgi:hypothetical protein
MKVYEDCITHSITTDSPFPIWGLMKDSGEIIGCAGLISNDFMIYGLGYVLSILIIAIVVGL